MANYYGYTRTNYFKVTNEDEFFKLLDECATDDPQGIEVWTSEDNGGSKTYAFGCESDLFGLCTPVTSEDCAETEEGANDHVCYDYDRFIEELQKLLPDGEAVLITNIGKEKLCYLHGDMHVVTNKITVLKDLRSIGLETARELLGEAEWDTKCEY